MFFRVDFLGILTCSSHVLERSRCTACYKFCGIYFFRVVIFLMFAHIFDFHQFHQFHQFINFINFPINLAPKKLVISKPKGYFLTSYPLQWSGASETSGRGGEIDGTVFRLLPACLRNLRTSSSNTRNWWIHTSIDEIDEFL